MRIDFDAVPKDPRGNELRGKPSFEQVIAALMVIAKTEPDTTAVEVLEKLNKGLAAEGGQSLADIAYDSLLNTKQATEGKANEKRQRFKLARKVAEGGIVDVDEEERRLLTKCLEEACTASSLVACEELLVPVPEESDEGQDDDSDEAEESEAAE